MQPEVFPFANKSHTQNIGSQKPVPLHHSQSCEDISQSPEIVCHPPHHFMSYTWQPHQAWTSTHLSPTSSLTTPTPSREQPG